MIAFAGDCRIFLLVMTTLLQISTPCATFGAAAGLVDDNLKSENHRTHSALVLYPYSCETRSWVVWTVEDSNERRLPCLYYVYCWSASWKQNNYFDFSGKRLSSFLLNQVVLFNYLPITDVKTVQCLGLSAPSPRHLECDNRVYFAHVYKSYYRRSVQFCYQKVGSVSMIEQWQWGPGPGICVRWVVWMLTDQGGAGSCGLNVKLLRTSQLSPLALHGLNSEHQSYLHKITHCGSGH